MPLAARCAAVAALCLCLSGAAAAQTVTWDHRPVVKFGDVELSIRARVQGDHRSSDAPFLGEDESAFEIARKRVGLDGRVGRFVDFQIERELDNDRPWRDVYVNYRQFDAIQVQAGKFKLPFSLEETTSASNLDFVYRSMGARYLAPGRDRGVMVHGRLLGRVLRYEAGVFSHDGDNAFSPRSDRVRGGRTKALRLLVQPLRHVRGPAAGDLQFGAAWATTDVPDGFEQFSTIRGRTAFEQTFFSSEYYVNGRRARRGIEMRWRPGPVSVKSEWIRVSEERLGEGVEDNDLSPLTSTGWYITGSWVLTGEAKADGVDPKRPLFEGGLGAVEIAVRTETLRFESGDPSEQGSTSPRADAVLGNENRAVTFGVTWYLNRWVKVQLNLIRETLTDPEQGPLPTQPSYWNRVIRFQFIL